MSFSTSLAQIELLSNGLSQPSNANDTFAKSMLLQVERWKKSFIELDSADHDDCFDKVIAKLLTHLVSESHNPTVGTSYYLTNGTFGANFAGVQGLISGELVRKRKEFEQLAKIRASREQQDAEKIIAALSEVANLEAATISISKKLADADAHATKVVDLVGKAEASQASITELKNSIENLVLEARADSETLLIGANESVANLLSEAKASCDSILLEANKNAELISGEANEHQASCNKAASGAAEASKQANIDSAAITTLLARLEKHQADSEGAFKSAQDALISKTIELEEATQKLSKARADLNAQGLSNAFAIRAQKLTTYRHILDCVFISLTFVLALVVIGFRIHYGVKDMTWVEWATLISPLSLVIWLAWKVSSRSEIVGRLIEDYEFKTATALAFQGYKKEAAEANPSLLENLIERAITNFGVNPVRLMPRTKSTHNSAAEALVEKLGGIVKDFAEAAKAAKP